MPLTILVVTRNRLDFLKHVASELANRVRQDDQVLIIDDGSDVDPASALQILDDRCQINYVRHVKHAGYITRRNEGILAARHECILQIDDDSWPVERDALSRCEIALAKFPKVGAFALPIHYHWSKADEGCGSLSRRWTARHLAREYAFMGCGVILRRSAVIKAGLYPAYYGYGCEETALAMRLHRIGFQIRMLRDVRIIHGHEVLSAARAYEQTRTADPRIGIIANELCLAQESYPWPMNRLIGFSIRLRARLLGQSVAEVERSYQTKRESIDPNQRQTLVATCTWTWNNLICRLQRRFAGLK